MRAPSKKRTLVARSGTRGPATRRTTQIRVFFTAGVKKAETVKMPDFARFSRFANREQGSRSVRASEKSVFSCSGATFLLFYAQESPRGCLFSEGGPAGAPFSAKYPKKRRFSRHLTASAAVRMLWAHAGEVRPLTYGLPHHVAARPGRSPTRSSGVPRHGGFNAPQGRAAAGPI